MNQDLSWDHNGLDLQTLSEEQLEGKSGASSRGNSSSNRVYKRSCSYSMLVVGFLELRREGGYGHRPTLSSSTCLRIPGLISRFRAQDLTISYCVVFIDYVVSLSKLQCFRQACAGIRQHGINELDRVPVTGLLLIVGLKDTEMVNRDRIYFRGRHQYLISRGEIL